MCGWWPCCGIKGCKDAVWQDKFSTTKSGYTTAAAGFRADNEPRDSGFNTGGNPVFTVSGGRIELPPDPDGPPITYEDNDGGATYYRTFNRPTTTPYVLQVRARVWRHEDTFPEPPVGFPPGHPGVGVFIGANGTPFGQNQGELFGVRPNGTFNAQLADAIGNWSGGGGGAFSTPTDWTDGEVLTLKITVNASGPATLQFYRGESLFLSYSRSVMVPPEVNIGLFAGQGGYWDDLCIWLYST